MVVEFYDNELKLCSSCKQQKGISSFHLKGVDKAGRTRYQSSCKDCANRKRVKRYFNKKINAANNARFNDGYVVNIHYYEKEMRPLDTNKLMNDYIEAVYATEISKAP